MILVKCLHLIDCFDGRRLIRLAKPHSEHCYENKNNIIAPIYIILPTFPRFKDLLTIFQFIIITDISTSDKMYLVANKISVDSVAWFAKKTSCDHCIRLHRNTGLTDWRFMEQCQLNAVKCYTFKFGLN